MLKMRTICKQNSMVIVVLFHNFANRKLNTKIYEKDYHFNNRHRIDGYCNITGKDELQKRDA